MERIASLQVWKLPYYNSDYENFCKHGRDLRQIEFNTICLPLCFKISGFTSVNATTLHKIIA